MGLRFSKSIKINDYLKINISKSGVSASVGKKGASINLGTNGTYLNLSPTAVGIKGTGVSYRTKLTGGVKDIVKKFQGEDEKKSSLIKKDTSVKENEAKEENTAEIENYALEQETRTAIHKYADNVISKEEYDANISSLESDATKEIYQLSIDGDEETVESLIGSFINGMELNYEVNVNYELEDHILYVDLDLPEIENLSVEYPAINNGKKVIKRKTNTELKEEYLNLILSIGVYLTANFFNISSYIDTVVLSAFSQRRNKDGDLVDEYLYSVKYTRDIYEKTDLSTLEDLYQFILKFENRINKTSDNSLKEIKPYEMESAVKANSMVEEAIMGLKELGYKVNDINTIREELSKLELSSSGEYLKAGLKILSQNK